MKQFLIGLCLAVVCLGLGLASSALVRDADAEDALGRRFTECFGATLEAVPGQQLERSGSPQKTVRIPQGWTPIGVVGPAKTVGVGASANGGGVIVLCR